MKNLIIVTLLTLSTPSWGEQEVVLYCIEHGITKVDSTTSRYTKAHDGIKSIFKLTENHVQESNETERFDMI